MQLEQLKKQRHDCIQEIARAKQRILDIEAQEGEAMREVPENMKIET